MRRLVSRGPLCKHKIGSEISVKPLDHVGMSKRSTVLCLSSDRGRHMKIQAWMAAGLVLLAGIYARGATVTLTNSDAFGFTSFDTGLNWSDGLAPAPGNAYVVTNALTLRSPPAAGTQVFQGDSLSLGDGTTSATLSFKGTGGDTDVIVINNLLANLGIVGNGQGGVFTLAGAIQLGNGGISLEYIHRLNLFRINICNLKICTDSVNYDKRFLFGFLCRKG